MKQIKEPAFRIVKRDNITRIRKVELYALAIFVALFAGGLLLLSMGVNSFKFYKDMLTIGVIDNRFAYKNIEGFIKMFVPLLITSLALSLAFKMKFWNIGGEGQFIMGATAASAVALLLGETMATLPLIILMALSGAVFAGIYGMVVAVLKVKFGTNETLLTLMLNYIALYMLKFFGETKNGWNFFLSAESERPRFQTFSENAWMPVIQIGKFSLNISLIFAILLCVLVTIYLKKTKQGYEILVVGDSANTARYAGMKVNRIVIRTMFISACLIGLAGAFYVSTSHTLSTSVTNNVGWTGIIVAWLSKLNTLGIAITSILISVLQYGCRVASSEFPSIDSNFADLLQGIILFLILIADFFIRFKIINTKKARLEEQQ